MKFEEVERIIEEIVEEEPIVEIIEEQPEKNEEEVKQETLENNTEVVNYEEPRQLRKLTYTNRNNNSGSIRINRF